jgi:hypothetical protein
MIVLAKRRFIFTATLILKLQRRHKGAENALSDWVNRHMSIRISKCLRADFYRGQKTKNPAEAGFNAFRTTIATNSNVRFSHGWYSSNP